MTFISFHIQFFILTAIVCISYCVFLQNSSLFNRNRWFIFLATMAAFVIPFIHIPVKAGIPNVESVLLPEVLVSAGKVGIASGVFPTGTIMWIVWSLPLAYGLIRIGIALVRVLQLIQRSSKHKSLGYTLVETDGYEAFSVFHYIFLGKRLDHSDREHILKHELLHVQQFHSMDLLFMELVVLFQWFNPFVWLLQKALKENQEYLADHAVLTSGASVTHYHQLLLNQLFKTNCFQFSPFIHKSQLKNRIKMMTKSNPMPGKTRFWLAVTVILGSGVFFTLQGTESLSGKILKPEISMSGILVKDTVKKVTPKKEVAKTAVKMDKSKEVVELEKKEDPILTPEVAAKFQGGDIANFSAWVMENIKYPETAVKNGIQGKVYVQFDVNDKGSVVNVKIIRGVDPILDGEAVRVIKSSPAWTPAMNKNVNVTQRFTLPVAFALKK